MRVFIGYKSEDRERVRPLADALKLIGHDVFWDQEIPHGSTWRLAIGDKLSGADAAIFCWSSHTLDASAAGWVLDEADEALKQRKPMFSVMLDKVSPPMGHRQRQTSDFSEWSGAAGDPVFLALAQALTSSQAGAPLISPALAQRGQAKKSGGAGALPWIAAIVLGVGMMSIAGVMWFGRPGATAPNGPAPEAVITKAEPVPYDPAQLHPLVEAAVHKSREMRVRAQAMFEQAEQAITEARAAWDSAEASEEGYGWHTKTDSFSGEIQDTKLQGRPIGTNLYSGRIVQNGRTVGLGQIGDYKSYFSVELGLSSNGYIGRWLGSDFLGKASDNNGADVLAESAGTGERNDVFISYRTVSIDYPDGRRYEGRWGSLLYGGDGYDGYGVLWSKDGKVISAGKWEVGELVEPLTRED